MVDKVLATKINCSEMKTGLIGSTPDVGGRGGKVGKRSDSGSRKLAGKAGNVKRSISHSHHQPRGTTCSPGISSAQPPTHTAESSSFQCPSNDGETKVLKGMTDSPSTWSQEGGLRWEPRSPGGRAAKQPCCHV